MAIAPKLVYPGQLDETDPTGYPHGKAQNETNPGDDDGTPLEQTLVNDILGFQQALLVEAGIAPSGTPDKADASQYLDALKILMRRDSPSRLVFNNIRSQKQVANGSSDTNHAVVFSALQQTPKWLVFKQGSGGGDLNEGIRCENGLDWESFNIGLTSVGNSVDAACSANTLVVATGSNDNGLAYSTNETSFTQCTVSAFNMQTVFYTGATFIASGVGGVMRRSVDDGVTFIATTTGAAGWSAVHHAAQFARNPATGRVIGVPVAAGVVFQRSDDEGDNWDAITVPSKTWVGIACMDGVWIAVNTAVSNPVYQSLDDGLTWTQLTSTGFATTFSSRIFAHDGYFAAIAGNRIHYSKDGETWIPGQHLRPVGVSPTPSFRRWAYGGGGFCAAFQASSGDTYLTQTLQTGEFAS